MRQLKDLGLIIAYELHGFRIILPSKIFYYDISTKDRVLLYDDPSHIDSNRMNELSFNDGKCILYLIGGDGKQYYSVVDKKGNILVKPQTEFPEV